MKKLLVLIIALLAGSSDLFSQELDLMTFNIRYPSKNDGINIWENRKEKVAKTISYFNADVIGLQEALKTQIDDLTTRLPDYGWVGVAREDGKEKGEFAPIFYNKKKVKLLDSGTFWLSETPEKPSKSWDAALPRICTYAKLKYKRKIVFVFNVHFDHLGEVARAESAKLLKDKIFKISGNKPHILMGDFNIIPSEEPYKILTTGNTFFEDTNFSSKNGHFGPVGTFNGFKEKEDPIKRIDYIFAKVNSEIVNHATISMSWEGLFASDHFAVLATLKL